MGFGSSPPPSSGTPETVTQLTGAAHVVANADQVLVSGSGAVQAISLPNTGVTIGHRVKVVITAVSNTTTITPTGGAFLDGAATAVSNDIGGTTVKMSFEFVLESAGSWTTVSRTVHPRVGAVSFKQPLSLGLAGEHVYDETGTVLSLLKVDAKKPVVSSSAYTFEEYTDYAGGPTAVVNSAAYNGTANVTFTLPTAPIDGEIRTIICARRYRHIDISTSETIDGQSTYTIFGPENSVTLQYDSTLLTWHVIGKSGAPSHGTSQVSLYGSLASATTAALGDRFSDPIILTTNAQYRLTAEVMMYTTTGTPATFLGTALVHVAGSGAHVVDAQTWVNTDPSTTGATLSFVAVTGPDAIELQATTTGDDGNFSANLKIQFAVQP